jgi:hypothetical protein
MIVPDAVVETCRILAENLAGSAGDNMWNTPLSPTGELPATHWISAGHIEDEFAAMIEDANLLAAATGLPLINAQELLASCIVSDDEPHSVMATAGLQMIGGGE